jgi:hypothetical protein
MTATNNESVSLFERFKSTKVVVSISVIVLLIVAEILFDIFEIGIGRLFWLTNPIRPQTGRLWEEDHKEQLGLNELDSAVVQDEPEPLNVDQELENLQDLEALLSIRQSMMNREEFNEFYKMLPKNQSRQILDPLDLFALNRGAEWHKTQLSLSGDQLIFYFLDGYEKPIQETHVSLRPEEALASAFSSSELQQLDKFRGRFVPADVFYQAFDRLPRAYQLQIVNDPYKLVQWEDSLQRVGLSPYLEANGVEIVFEIKEEPRTRYQSMYASEMAIAYLIRELNAVEGAPKLQPPIVRETHAEKDY